MSLPALVLTAGLATRLRPLSAVRAKAALPVAGVPLAGRVLQWLAGHGIRDCVLNLHHLPHTLTRVIGDGTGLGVRVRYSNEDPVLGSAGGPRHALPLLDSPRAIIVNGDTLTDLDLRSMVAAHERSGARVTLALIPNPHPERYGGVLVDGNRVAGFVPRRANAVNHHFIGVQVVECEVFAPLPDNTPAESVSGVYRRLLLDDPHAIRAFISDARFEDVGTVRDYFETSMAVGSREGLPPVHLGERTRVDSTALVDRCILWDDVVVGPRAALTDCIVTDGVRVPAGAQLDRSVILPATTDLLGAPAERRDNLLIAPF